MAASVLPDFNDSSSGSQGVTGSRSPATRIGRYEIAGEVGRGGLVKVFRGLDSEIGRPVTLKVLTDISDTALAGRFRNDVSSIARLHTPSLVPIYELGEHVGFPFAAMQAATGETLRQIVQTRRPLSLLQKMLIMSHVADGLQQAHEAGMAHVAIRPSGIVVESGQAMIHDFGMVRLTPSDEEEFSAHLAPEQTAAGYAPDLLCDIFAFGVIYYELLTACQASGSEELPESLDRLVVRAMEKRRDLRYQTLDEIQDDAEPILTALKRARTAELVAEARRLADGAPEEADARVREILQLEPQNEEAHRLRGRLRAILRRESSRRRMEHLLNEASQEIAVKRFDSASELLESAPPLEEADPDLNATLERLRDRVEHGRRAVQLCADARQLLAQQNLEGAQSKAAEALAADPENEDAAELSREIGRAIDRRRQEARIEEGVSRAKSLLLLQAFDDALAILRSLRVEFPSSMLVEQWLDHARRQKEEAHKHFRLQKQLKEARSLIAQERFSGAILLLGDLRNEFPDEAEVSDLFEHAKQAKDRSAAVLQTVTECERLRSEGQLEHALEVVGAALSAYPGDSALSQLHRELEGQWQASKSEAAVKGALEEANWLLQKDRPNLAVELLRQKAAEFPERSDLAARLAEVESIFHDWERRRLAQETLRQVTALEELEQWQVALTVVEEALETHPLSPELLECAERLRGRLSEQERRKKLARRLDTIGQRIAAHSWPQALSLIAAAEKEFPGEPELQRRREEAEEGSRQAELENFAAEVRQQLADGDIEQAGDLLHSKMEAGGSDPLFEALRQEIESARRYRDDWHTAQVLFGRRQFEEAEKILVRLASPDHPQAMLLFPQAMLLLEKAREARAADEEDSFYKRLRDKALGLIERQQWDEAADLLNNLLALFPDDPVIQRDLQTVEPHLAKPAETPAPEARPSEPPPEIGEQPKTEAPPDPSYFREYSPATRTPRQGIHWGFIAGIVFLLLAVFIWVVAGWGSRSSRGGAAAPAATASAEPAKKISGPEPTLPPLLQQLKGEVKLEATVDAAGAVRKVAVISGDETLAAAAQIAVWKWRYRPAMQNGKPVETKVPIKVVFQ